MPESYGKWFILGAVLLFILALMGAGVSVYLSSDAFQHRLLAAVNRRINGEISLDRLDLNLISGGLELHDLRLNGADGNLVAALEQVRLRLAWWPLIKKHIRIGELSVTVDDIRLIFNPRDRLELLDALSPPSPRPQDRPQDRDEREAFSWRLSVEDLHLEIRKLEFQRPAMEMHARTEQVGIKGNFDSENQEGTIRVRVGQAAWEMSGRPGLIRDAQVALSHDPGLRRPLILTLQTPHSNLRVSAVVDWSDPLETLVETLDAEITYDLDWTDIRPWLPPELSSGLSQRVSQKVSMDEPFAGVISGRAMVQGRLFDPSVSLHLAMKTATLAGVAVQSLEGRVKLHERLITVEKLESQSLWGHLTLGGELDLSAMFKQDFTQAEAGPEALIYDLNLDADGVRPRDFPLVNLPVQGIWNGHFTLQGKGIGDPGSTGKSVIDAGMTMDTTDQQIQGNISAQFGWEGRRIDFPGIKAGIGPNLLEAGGHIDLTGVADWMAAKIDIQGELSMPRPSLLEPFTGVELPTGRSHLTFVCSGPLSRPRAAGTVLARELAYQSWQFGQIFFNAELNQNGTLLISDMMLENQGTVISGDGHAQLFQADGRLDPNPGLGAQLAIENLQLSHFGLLEALKGYLNGNLRISGRLKDPLASLDLKKSSVGWRELDALAEGSAGWKGGRLDVDALRLTKGTSTLDLSGSLAWRDAKTGQWTAVPVLDLHASTAGLELNDVLSDYHGGVDFKARVKGRATDLLGDFKLEAEQVGLPVQKFNAVKLKGRLAGAVVHIDQMNVALAPDQNISGSGWYAFDQRYSMSLAAESINLRYIDALQQVYPVDGRLSAALDGSGTLSHPNLEAVLTVAEPRFNGQALDDFQGQFSLTGKAIRFQGDLNFQVRARGDLDTHTYSLTADFNDTDLAPYLALWPGQRWSGRLTGNLQATGDWQAPERTTGRLELDQWNLDYDKRPFIAAQGLNLLIENNTVTMPTKRLSLLQDGYLDIGAGGNLVRDLRLRVDGRLPLTALAPFTDALSDADGAVDLQARTEGPLSKLQWQADLNLKDISFGLSDFSQVVENLNGTVQVRPDTVKVKGVAGTVDSGRFELGGNIRLDGGVPADGRLDLSLHALPLQWPNTMEMVISGDMALAGTAKGAILSGGLVLVEGIYYKDVHFNFLSGITQPRRSRPVPDYRPKPDWMKHIALDLKLRHRNPFLVDNNLASLEVTPDFHLGGTAAKPVMSGRAAVTEGELMYARKTFTVQRGVVDFVNPNKIEPNLDIMGTVEFRKWVITLGVSGTPNNLAFTLSSDPEESDSDILSLLLVGRTNAEMTQGEGGGRQTTNQMLAQLLATAWGEDIKREAGVDIFELGAGSEEDVDDPTSMQLTVGKKLSRRLTVKYGVETQEGETIQRAISEYRFLEHILASGFQDSRGKYGGELLFRMDYR